MLRYWSRLCSSASCAAFQIWASEYFQACAKLEGGGVSRVIDMGTKRTGVVFVRKVCGCGMEGSVLLW